MSDTANYGILGIASANGMFVGNAYIGAYTTSIDTTTIDSNGMSGVYAGSLSAQGNMVAMQLNVGGYKYAKTGRIITVAINEGFETVEEVAQVPYLTGYARSYFKDPVQCTFGSDSAMPALTGVMPASLNLPGNMLYYLDLQLTRLTGSNYVNPYQFVNTIGQVMSWVMTTNSYKAALKNAESTNLAYYGADSYQSLITQGFAKYKQGNALVECMRVQGLMAQTLNTGYFGTANAVAKVLIDNGLGYINNLSDRLLQLGVEPTDIYNTKYTAVITQELENITNQADLITIQEVLESDILNMTSPMDYCSITKASRLPNDSAFASLEDFGKDIHNLAPGFNITNGLVFAFILDNLQVDVPDSVENNLSTADSLLKPEIIANLRKFLPVGDDNGPISMLQVIGAASGYLTVYMDAVNEGMTELYATSYGPRIRSVLQDLSRYGAGVPANDAERQTAEKFVPPPETPFQTYYQVKADEKRIEYYTLLDELVADTTGRIPVIVKKINDNYMTLCKNLSYEHTNFNLSLITPQDYQDNGSVYGFVGTLPAYAVDSQNIGTDTMIYGTCQPNEAGDVARTIMDQGKNSSLLAAAGVQVTGIL